MYRRNKTGTILFLVFITCVVEIVSTAWVMTAAVSEVYSNGRDGDCEYPSDGNLGSPVCTDGWVNFGTTGERRTLQQQTSCTYYGKTTTYICYEDSSLEGPRRELCTRERNFYYMMTSCYEQWLDWEACTRECGGGISQRYKFLSSRQTYSTQVRTCNEQSCPRWSSWEALSDACDNSCFKTWNRECLYNGVAVASHRCEVEVSPYTGNQTHQIRPCPVENCDNYQFIPQSIPTTAGFREYKSTVISNAGRTTTKGAMQVNNRTDDTTYPINYDQLKYNKNVSEPKAVTSSIWIGFGIGVVGVLVILLLLLLIFSRTHKGKETLNTLRTYRIEENPPRFEKRERLNSSIIDKKTNRTSLDSRSWNREPKRRNSQANGLHLQSSFRKGRSTSVITTESTSGRSQYQEPVDTNRIDFETYYTPVGENKLLHRNKLCPGDPVYAAISDYRHDRRDCGDDFSSDGEVGYYYEDQLKNFKMHQKHPDKSVIVTQRRHNSLTRRHDRRSKMDRHVRRIATEKPSGQQRPTNDTSRRRITSSDRHQRDQQGIQRRENHKSQNLDRQPIAKYSMKPQMLEPDYSKPMKRRARERNEDLESTLKNVELHYICDNISSLKNEKIPPIDYASYVATETNNEQPSQEQKIEIETYFMHERSPVSSSVGRFASYRSSSLSSSSASRFDIQYEDDYTEAVDAGHQQSNDVSYDI